MPLKYKLHTGGSSSGELSLTAWASVDRTYDSVFCTDDAVLFPHRQVLLFVLLFEACFDVRKRHRCDLQAT